MATKQSSKLVVDYRGAKLQFGLHKPTGQYRKKYSGKTLYLGSDPDHVLDQWLSKTELVENELLGKPNRSTNTPLTLSDLCNRFLADKEAEVTSGELSQVTFDQYFQYAKRLTGFFGRDKLVSDLGSDDFARLKADLSKPKAQKRGGKIVRKAKQKLSLNGLASKIRHIKVFFNYAYGEGWIDQLPWGSKSFKAPTPKAIKKATAGKKPKQATAKEIRTLIESADDTWKALILYAINTGSGNFDASLLQWSDIGEDGWIEKPRHKTGEYRRFKLWPETIEAINKLPKSKDGYVFHSSQGALLVPKSKQNPVTVGFTKLADKAGVNRESLTFYSMRHTFQTIADEALDFVATQIIMGHKRTSISDKYRGKISDERLMAVTNHVRKWLFGSDGGKD